MITLLGLMITAEFAIAKSADQAAASIVNGISISEKYKRIAQDIVDSGQKAIISQSKQYENGSVASWIRKE